MAYIVIKSNGQEIARQELAGPLVIGRAPDCDLAVPDILLSRRHCRIEFISDHWRVLDLQSKNGTVINGERLARPYQLLDNDVVRLGRSRIVFHEGILEEDLAAQPPPTGRPLDPGDTLSGTLSGFTLLLPGEGEIPQDMPCPQPRPKDPPAYDQEELQTLLTAIASSSWDSIYAESRKPTLARPVLMEDTLGPRRVRPRSPMDFSLQVSSAPSAAPPARLERLAAPPPLPQNRRRRRVGRQIHAVVAAVWLAAIVLVSRQWKSLTKESMASPAARPPPAFIMANVPPAPLVAVPTPQTEAAPMPIKMNAATVRQTIKTAVRCYPIW